LLSRFPEQQLVRRSGIRRTAVELFLDIFTARKKTDIKFIFLIFSLRLCGEIWRLI
jgi:hypothetical protein